MLKEEQVRVQRVVGPTALVEALDQHDAGGGAAVFADGGHGHRVGLGQLGRQRLLEPAFELLQRIGRAGALVEFVALIALAQICDRA